MQKRKVAATMSLDGRQGERIANLRMHRTRLVEDDQRYRRTDATVSAIRSAARHG